MGPAAAACVVHGAGPWCGHRALLQSGQRHHAQDPVPRTGGCRLCVLP